MSELHGIKVMVIDDSRTIRRSAEILLKKEGLDVVVADDGYSALSMMFEVNPDIIFVDIMMPKLDGYQTCSLIKNNQKFKDLPIVLLSSKDGIFDKVKGTVVGADEYLTKPFTKEEILIIVKKLTKNNFTS